MRFVLAVVTLVIAALLVLLGLAQRTVFAPADSVTATSQSSSSAPLTLLPASALKAYEGRESIHIAGAKDSFAAYGRTADIVGWIGDTTYNRVSYDKATGDFTTKTVDGTSSTAPDPRDSDLWTAEYSGSDLRFSLVGDTDISVLVATDGSAAVPKTVSVTWPLSTATPLVGPLISAGLLVFVIGVLLFAWAVAHHRRTRGPRRSGGGKPPRLKRSERRGSVRSSRKAALGLTSGRGPRGRRMVAVVPVVLVTALGLSACSSDYWPQPATGDSTSAATPSATATAAPGDDLQPPAVTVPQAKRVIARITAVQTSADKDLDPKLAATRFTGPALQQRTASYTIRKADKTAALPVSIPSGSVSLTLPQQTDSWPRTVFALVQSTTSTKVAPVGVMLVQESARDPYKVDYLVGLEAGAQIPKVAPATIGAARLAPDVKLLALEPDKVAAAYAAILKNGDTASSASAFQADGDTLRDKIGKPYKDAKAKKLPSTASIAYSSKVGTEPSIAFATNDAGAIVSVSLDEIETVKPTKDGAEVNTEGEVKSLSGVSKSTKGIVATYGVQLLFSVPPVGSSDKIVLLGFSQALISAKEAS
ncbi:hypothetical protein [Frondihabitans sp. PhB188]|uniref:hypothetical protein n=1 Tax=Frondihabitans sp. PhB188 TaxID=2485200 RepID=UPI000F4A9F46|nr:hypothetical protein [Frondihabitans sp. PhB188]